jgi:class 3 adenylate cyclase
VVNHTGDGFFVGFPDAKSALDCAVDIQRRLRSHRREQGFAPAIRIGIHAADATRSGGGYTGKGVHVAARIGAEAAAEEILVSLETLAGAGDVDYSVADPRALTLKGVTDPVEVSVVDWR